MAKIDSSLLASSARMGNSRKLLELLDTKKKKIYIYILTYTSIFVINIEVKNFIPLRIQRGLVFCCHWFFTKSYY